MKNRIIIFLFLSFVACTKRDPIKKLEINKTLIIMANKAMLDTSVIQKFPFCELVPFKNWGKIIVVPPYLPWEILEKQHINNLNQIKDSIINITYNDSKCTLLFLLDRKITAYAVVSRSPVDFTELFDFTKIQKPVLKEVFCSQIYLKRETYKNQNRYIVFLKK